MTAHINNCEPENASIKSGARGAPPPRASLPMVAPLLARDDVFALIEPVPYHDHGGDDQQVDQFSSNPAY